ncbi:acyl-CoA dehydrogenase family protein [[Actinomadura] parvosata]|uniref:acyl-CoA dehydrogenase family protein n=1 Tax=[Actinomadura] parvosata TaxID=1955412 RepID=UPI00406C4118
MRQCLNERQRDFVSLAEKVAPALTERAAQHDRDNVFPHDNYADLREAGLMRLTVPETLGGLGAEQGEMLLVLERLAQADGATALAYAMHVAPLGSWAAVWRQTGNPMLEQVLGIAGKDGLVLAAISSEIGVSNLFLDARTKADRVPGGFLINGRKNFATNSAVATHCATTAQYDDPELGPRLFVVFVDMSDPAVTVHQTWDTLGMRATQSNDVVFQDLFVPEQAVVQSVPIGHFDAEILETIICWQAPSFGAVYTGVAAAGLEWTIERIRRRGLTRDTRIQDAIAECEMLLEVNRSVLARHAQEFVSRRLVEQLGVQEGLARCAFVKNTCTNNAVAIYRRLVDVLGGAAYTRTQPFERLWRDVQAGLIMPISNHMAQELIGATALGVAVRPVAGADGPALATTGSAG